MEKIIKEEMLPTDVTVNANIATIIQEVAALIYTDVTQ
jgi:hypothetical protein